MVSFKQIRAVLLDIEGTTTPVDFVYQKLFPYAAAHLEEFLRTSLEESDRKQLRNEYEQETANDLPLWSDLPLEYVRWLMQLDRKSRGLKSIQGKIWKSGYENGELRGELFPDVPKAFEKWLEARLGIYIYSSGSVPAQRLIFDHSVFGDLTSFISGYFDTAVGPKRAASSYETIANLLGLEPRQMLFISDIAEELTAAQEAGFAVLLSVRPGNKEQSGEWSRVLSFDEILFR